MEKKNYITPKGMQRLIDEQDQLLKVERPETLKVIAWAASLGDRSENADYQYAKRRLREIERRLRFLSKQIDGAVVVDPLNSKTDKVQFGATITIQNNEGVIKNYAIVGTDETDSKKGHISWKSPIAKALLGRSVGDYVVVTTPNGESELEIININYIELE